MTRSEANKKRWADPEYKMRVSASIKVALAKPEAKARQSAAQKAVLSTPGMIERLSESMKVALAKPEAKARKSASAKKRYENSEERARQSARVTQFCENNPKVRYETFWKQDTETREKMIRAIAWKSKH